jgi:hypothetical protein
LLRPAGFPHSDILGSGPAYRLPEAYRRLLRPSSAPDAKASTVCSSKLDHMSMNRVCRLATADMTNEVNHCDRDALAGHLNRRCSRPLCSSQSTVGTPSASAAAEPARGPRGSSGLPADPSGPNSVHAVDPPPRLVPDPGGSYLSCVGLPTAHRQRSTLELTTRERVSR